MNKRAAGSQYEEAACEFLRKKGYRILCRNFRCRIGEIDIVAMEEGTLVFAEVKYRKNSRCGHPEEAVSYYKQRKIIKTAQFYMCRFGIGDNMPCRFDIVAIEGDGIRLVKNAFNA